MAEENKKEPAKKKKDEEEEITEMTPEVIERLAAKANAQRAGGESGDSKDDKPKAKFGFGLFKKKPDKEETKQEPAQPAAAPQKDDSDTGNESPSEGRGNRAIDVLNIELEKIKTNIEALREEKKATDSNVTSVFESIGELRSMVFETDTTVKETSAKMERVEESVSFLKPDALEKELRERKDALEKHDARFEKIETQLKDMVEKLNSAYTLLKNLGSFENLVNLDKNASVKLSEIKELVKYIEKLSARTEKYYLAVSKLIEDVDKYKTRQEAFEESFNDLMKAVDTLNVRLDDFVSKKDMEGIKSDISVIQKGIEEIRKVLPIAEAKLPETIIKLKGERQDIEALLATMEEQYLKGKLSRADYNSVKKSNEERLGQIEEELSSQWALVKKILENPNGVSAGMEATEEQAKDDTKDKSDSAKAVSEGQKKEQLKTEEKKPDEKPVTPSKEKKDDGKKSKPDNSMAEKNDVQSTATEKFDLHALVGKMKGKV